MNYLDSFSGSKFRLFENNNIIYLKKFYKTINIRDIESFQKQTNFKNYNLGEFKISSAEISKIKKNSKFIILKHYNGLSGSELILKGNVQIHRTLNSFLDNYIKNLFINSKMEQFDKKIYLKKCNQIKNNILSKHRQLFKKISKSVYSKLDGVKYNIKGKCHGDLTLSNIIVNLDSKEIILIDFLKTYIDSPMQDVCKLIQDLRFYWSARKFSETDLIRAKIFCNNLNPFISIKKNCYFKLLELEMLMTLLRILPYVPVKDSDTMNWLEISYERLTQNFLKNL